MTKEVRGSELAVSSVVGGAPAAANAGGERCVRDSAGTTRLQVE